MDLSRRAVVSLFAALAVVIAIVVGTAWRDGPSRVAASDASSDSFSATRAMTTLARITEDRPHATGTHALDAARARTVDALRAIGLDPMVTESIVCGRHGVCARVHHTAARLEGTSKEVVLIAAHLDAVPAGPGAADDGQGVAIVIELARALQLHPRNGRSFVFLIDEGEEQGLLGMEGFLRDHPWARNVRAAVNVEARGDEGLPVLFEVGGDGSVMRSLAPTLPSVFTSSLAAAIYAHMPNDTDFSLLRDAGIVGANLAVVGGVGRYHTAIDDSAHLSLGSVQRQGEAALAAARALAVADLRPHGRTAWIDVAPFGVLAYGQLAAIATSLLALAIVVMACARERRRRALSLRSMLFGASSMLLLPLGAALFAELVRRLVVLAGAAPVPFLAQPRALWTAAFASALLPAGLLVSFARGRIDTRAWMLGASFLMVSASLLLSLFAVPMTPLMLPAALAASLGVGLLVGGDEAAVAVTAHALFAAGPAFAASMAAVLGPSIAGQLGAAPVAATFAVATIGLVAPTMEVCTGRLRHTPIVGALAVTVMALAIAATRPPFDADAPQRANVQLAAIAGSPTRAWVAAEWGRQAWGSPPRSMVAALGPEVRTDAIAMPWQPRPMPFVDLPTVNVPLPIVDRVKHDGGMVSLHATSQREATTFVLLARGASAGSWRALGADATPRAMSNGWSALYVLGVPSEGFDAVVAESAELLVFDIDWKAPPALEPVIAARPSNAQPSQEGDAMMAGVRVGR